MSPKIRNAKDYADRDIARDHTYTTCEYIITANPQNDLEMTIIRAIKEDPALQMAFEFEESNRLFHPEVLLGKHVEQILGYWDRQCKRYSLWANHSNVVRPALIWHDMGKSQELWTEPKMPHQDIAALRAQDILNLSDIDPFVTLILHHDDIYRLYREKRDPEIATKVQTRYEGWHSDHMERLILFYLADHYQPRPRTKGASINYYRTSRLFREQIDWFSKITKQLGFIDSNFNAFSQQ